MGTYPDIAIPNPPFRPYAKDPEIFYGDALNRKWVTESDLWNQPHNNGPCYGIDGSSSKRLIETSKNAYYPMVLDSPGTFGDHILTAPRDPYYEYNTSLRICQPLGLEVRVVPAIMTLRAAVNITFGYVGGTIGYSDKDAVVRMIYIMLEPNKTYDFDFHINNSSTINEGTIVGGSFRTATMATVSWTTITGRVVTDWSRGGYTLTFGSMTVTDSGATNNQWNGGCRYAPGGTLIVCSPNGDPGDDASGTQKSLMADFGFAASWGFYNDILPVVDPGYVQIQPDYPVTYGPGIAVVARVSGGLTLIPTDLTVGSYDSVYDSGDNVASALRYKQVNRPELTQYIGFDPSAL